jgi:hypothetical protein
MRKRMGLRIGGDIVPGGERLRKSGCGGYEVIP